MGTRVTNLTKPNILVVGRAGVGKSSLINAIFDWDLAATGSGSAITMHYTRYENDNVDVTLFDSKGWEGGDKQAQAFIADTKSFLQSFLTRSIDQHLHIIWYAIDASGARFTDYDQYLIGNLFAVYPVIVVLTKCDIARETEKSAIANEIAKVSFANVKDVVMVSAAPIVGSQLGLERIVDTTQSCLPNIQRHAFLISSAVFQAQQANLQGKKEIAKRIIYSTMGITGTTGFFPLTGLVTLIPIQLGMIVAIGRVYDFSAEEVRELASRDLVLRLLRMTGLRIFVSAVPGIGSVSNAALTYAIGVTFQRLFNDISVAQEKLDKVWVQNYIESNFKEIWKLSRDQHNDLSETLEANQ